MCEKSDITDVIVEQGLLDNIDLTLDALRPILEDLGKTHLAVVAYKEFQTALSIKSRRIKEDKID